MVERYLVAVVFGPVRICKNASSLALLDTRHVNVANSAKHAGTRVVIPCALHDVILDHHVEWRLRSDEVVCCELHFTAGL